MRRSIVIGVIITLIATVSCQEHYKAAGEFRALPNEALAYTDTIDFTIANLDTISDNQLYVAVVHSNDYPYSNLWLEVTYKDSTQSICDTVALTMADQYGNWQGKALGATYQIESPACTEISPRGDFHVSVRHIMRADTLPGLARIGILAK